MVHKIAIFDAFKWNKLPLHRSIYHTVKFYKSPYQTYKNKSRGEGRVHYIHFISNLFPGSSLFAPSKKRERGAWERDFGIRYFWEFKRNLTNVCRFPIWWVINRSLKIYFCFNTCVTYVHSLWCRNVAVSDKGKQLETAFITFISCYHAIFKTETKTIKNENWHYFTPRSWPQNIPGNPSCYSAYISRKWRNPGRNTACELYFYNSNHWFFLSFLNQWKHNIIQKFHRCDWSNQFAVVKRIKSKTAKQN